MGRFLRNIYHELNDRLYVEFEPSQRPPQLPCPVRLPLNLQPIPSCPLPEYTETPPPPYTDDEERPEIILQYKNTSILFKIGEKNCISYNHALLMKNPNTRWYTSSTGNNVVGQTLINDIPFYIENRLDNTIGSSYASRFPRIPSRLIGHSVYSTNLGCYCIIDPNKLYSTSPVQDQHFKIGNESFTLTFQSSSDNFITLGRDFYEKYIDDIDKIYNTIYLKNENVLIGTKIK
jgi:hypothetical protein